MRTIKRILGVFLFALTLVLVAPSILPVNGNVYTVEAATKINKKKVTLIKGQTTALKISGTKKKAKWSSSKKSVATVSSKGKVTAKKKGTATITAKIGNKKYTCKVTVQTPKISSSKITISIGETSKIKVNGTDQKITWKSANKKIATVDKNGNVVGKKAGKVKITATVLKKKYSCTVTVKKKTLQDDILSKIDKKIIKGRYYGSDWNNALICIFKNNSGYDLTFGVNFSADNYNATGYKECSYFKNGEECIIIFDFYNFKDFKLSYDIKKTPENIKFKCSNVDFTTFKKEFNVIGYKCLNKSNEWIDLDGAIVYFDSKGNIIDYSKISWGTVPGGDFEDEFDLPVNKNLDTAPYSYYKTFYNIY